MTSKAHWRWLAAACLTLWAAVGTAQVMVSVSVAPPALPLYVQPPLPGPGYVWVPGYWAYSDDGYYWVPGTWIEPPAVGLLWTPGYWGWASGAYIWNAGYWGPAVGFYGGINYGFGYPGTGYYGGRWQNGQFNYNRSVTNITNTNVTNVYNETVVNNTNSRASYNGGRDGITAQPTAAQMAAARERRISPSAAQTQHERAARGEQSLRVANNHGQPPGAATARAGQIAAPSHAGSRAEKAHSPSPANDVDRRMAEAQRQQYHVAPAPERPSEHMAPQHEPPREAPPPATHMARPEPPRAQPVPEHVPPHLASQHSESHRAPPRPPQERPHDAHPN
jgi:hypothetical protein